jgi:hypothetical protein
VQLVRGVRDFAGFLMAHLVAWYRLGTAQITGSSESQIIREQKQ